MVTGRLPLNVNMSSSTKCKQVVFHQIITGRLPPMLSERLPPKSKCHDIADSNLSKCHRTSAVGCHCPAANSCCDLVNYTDRKKIGENWNFNEYLLMGRSETHRSLKFQRYMTFTPPYFLRIFSNSVYLMSMQSVPECMSSSSSCLRGLYSQCLPAISVVRFSCLHGLYCRCSPATVSLLSPTCLHDLYSRCSPATVSLLSASAVCMVSILQ